MRCPECGLGDGDPMKIHYRGGSTVIGKVQNLQNGGWQTTKDNFWFHVKGRRILPDGTEVDMPDYITFVCFCGDGVWKKERLTCQLELFEEQDMNVGL